MSGYTVHRRLRRNLPVITGIGVFWLSLLHAGWMKWGNILIDSWRDPYVAWRMVEDGVNLYTDVVYEFGFLPPCVLAAVARVFGCGPQVFIGVGTMISLAVTVLVYRISRFFIPRVWSAGVVVSFLTVCVFRALEAYDLGSYILPYSFAATFFVLWICLSLYAMLRWIFKSDTRFLWMAGIALALAGWSRPLMTLPVFLAMATVWLISSGKSFRLPVRLGAVLVPPVLCAAGWVIYFSLYGGAFEYWQTIRGQAVMSYFYRNMLGLRDFQDNLMKALAVGVCYSAVLGGFAATGGKFFNDRRTLRNLFCLAVVCGGFLCLQRIDSFAVFMPVPYLITIAVVRSILRREALTEKTLTARIALYSVSLLMLSRVFFKVYPTVSSAASTYLALGLVSFWVIGYDAVSRVSARSLPWAGIYLSLLFLPWLQIDLVTYAWRSVDYRVPGSGYRVNLVPDKSSEIVAGFLTWASTDIAKKSTMFVVPEGIGLNYLTGIRNPLPYYHANPSFINTFGEDTFIAALASARPDYIVHVNRITRDFGAPFFGRDYGRLMYQWIRDNYVVEKVFGTDEFDWNNFGIVVYKRRVEMNVTAGGPV